jgi:hypothetical protein
MGGESVSLGETDGHAFCLCPQHLSDHGQVGLLACELFDIFCLDYKMYLDFRSFGKRVNSVKICTARAYVFCVKIKHLFFLRCNRGDLLYVGGQFEVEPFIFPLFFHGQLPQKKRWIK